MKKLIAGEITTGDVALTVEPNVQSMLEKNLEKTKEKYKAQTVGGMIINPKTGEIIAMSAKPDFNPNQYAKTKDFSIFMNPLVESVIEMGSIMKPLTLAASMDNGSITASTTYTDNGFLAFGPSRIENYDGKARGKSGYAESSQRISQHRRRFCHAEDGQRQVQGLYARLWFRGKNRHRIASGSEK